MFKKLLSGYLPLPGSDIASQWDSLFSFLFWLSAFFVMLILGLMIYFSIQYRHHKGHKTKYILGNHALEIFWTIVPTVLVMIIFVWGYQVYRAMVQPPADAYEVRVIGKQWLWQFQYDDGRMTVGDLYVPVNRPIKLVMSSDDVIHSFFIPNFRVKQDVVPGLYTTVWFEPTLAGRHQVYCAEYCGTAHSNMLANLYVLESEQWEAWKRGKKIEVITDAGGGMGVPDSKASAGVQPKAVGGGDDTGSLAEQGKRFVATKGCVACHSDDGTTRVGPTFKGVFGHKVELADGSKVTVDENYLHESIENPQAKLVKGFSPVMPTFKGLLSEAEMNAMIAYIKSLK